jgi:hypothetical protein
LIDRTGLTWIAIERVVGEQLASARQRLETHGRSHEDTEYERGRIAAFKWLLKLPERPTGQDAG